MWLLEKFELEQRKHFVEILLQLLYGAGVVYVNGHGIGVYCEQQV
jgi:hypothetical protein